VATEYNKKNMDVIANLWDRTKENSMVCPKCNSKMVMIQLDPIQDYQNPYVAYDSIIECTKCDYKIRTESFTILGSVKSFDLKEIEIASWSPSGSRVISRYEHVLDYNLLKKLKDSGDLKEFLVVNNQVVQVIG
jgi:DNA-directed RNA polymerase subunit RPC12/RpoP